MLIQPFMALLVIDATKLRHIEKRAAKKRIGNDLLP